MSKPITALILAPHCNTFIEDTVKACSGHIKSASVIVHHNPLSEFSNVLPSSGYISHIKKFTKKNIVPEERLPDNVRLHIVSFPYLIPDASNKRLAEKIADRAIKLIENEGIEFNLIHAHFTWPNGGAGVRLKKKYDAPLVITAHGFDVYALPFKDPIWNAIVKQTMNEADQIITVSQNNARCLEKLGIEKPINIIPNGFQSNSFHPLNQTYSIRSKLRIPLNKRVILSVGGLEHVKGHEVLISAMNHITKKRHDVVLVIVGSGSQRNMLEKKVYDYGLGDSVIFTGARPHAEVPLWINICDVFALPSLNEGNPTVMFECLGCGRPFVGTRVGGIPDIISSDDYGLLCDPENPNDLSEKILMALDREWDQSAIIRYAERYTWENISRTTVGVYRQALSQF